MAAFTHTLSDGLKLQVHLKRSAKKNIILRPVSAEAISVNAPPFLSLPKLAAWLQTNEPLLRQTLQRAPASSLAHLPAQIWYRGEATSILSHPYSTIRHNSGTPEEMMAQCEHWIENQQSQISGVGPCAAGKAKAV